MRSKIKQTFYALITILFSLIIISCSNNSNSQEKFVIEINNLLDQGNQELAIETIDKYINDFGSDEVIISLKALSYSQLGEYENAARYSLEAIKLNPSYKENIFKSLDYHKKANLEYDQTLFYLDKINPSLIDSNEWIYLSEIYESINEIESSINALLNGIKEEIENNEIDSSNALKLGELYFKLEKYKESQSWLVIAADSKSADSLAAYMKILEIEKTKENWNAIEQIITTLEKKFPGSLNNTQYLELKSINKQKEELNDQNLLTLENNRPSKSGVTNDIEDLEMIANLPAIKNDDLLISNDIENNTNENLNDLLEEKDVDSFLGQEVRTRLKPKVIKKEKIASIIKQAENAIIENELDKAISLYLKILGDHPYRDDIWHQISKVYLASKKYKDAEITSLESIRINPEKVDYTLTFLRVSQKIKSEYLFISELIIAFKKFPDNSEITLMLARAYDRTGKNKVRALEYYKKFISLSPNNPFREEAENAILRLSRNS